MSRLLALVCLALTISACAAAGGGSAPAGNATPQRPVPAASATPSGNPDVDNYGY